LISLLTPNDVQYTFMHTHTKTHTLNLHNTMHGINESRFHLHDVANTRVLSPGPAAGQSGSKRCGLLSALLVQLHAGSRYSEARGHCGGARMSLLLPRLHPLQLGDGGGGGFVSRHGGGVEGGRDGTGEGAAGCCGGRLWQLV
jgi:hypothetical protein